ncbi:ribosomal large subunit pseudouridine synthase A [Corallococcus coralloides DSM 2259]|uniref:Ribosomal large subunit pseudouridine synthase A n=1 Tax=Corallococcus coralloides (strain ATCC 25202 / DSM 2259 / NBRC 100086 / M2) TaxID=1144275 RepID=H8MGW2_CORCM|nr:pseudouridine synthase [Corallococcus coralloides]AFE10159.1 ribosomal large subunit pseudouridine synthase A [Corallococcus coralloides DSM 2259]
MGPHALARRAAEALQATLREGFIAPGLPSSILQGPDGGKMFGVLVVRQPDGTPGTLRAFSAMLAGRWDVPGFVPPVFDREARARVEPVADATVKALLARTEAWSTSEELHRLREDDDARQSREATEREAMRLRHDARRRQRHERRAAILAMSALTETERAQALHALDQESRGDKAEKRRWDAAQEEARRLLAPARAKAERRVRALDRLRRIVSRGFMKQFHDTYAITNARGETRPLRSLYGGAEPPSGAGDCAGAKLLAHAFAHGLQPVALAEFWWGTPPASGGRIQGAFYPACRDKCGPLLPFMLEGLEVSAPRVFVPPPAPTPELSILFEDAWLVVIDKPCGLLSVPGRDASLLDSVLTRLRTRYPHATGPLLAHRLDLDTSGLLVAALDSRTHASLQRQFLHRDVAKRYVALIDGPVHGDAGTITLPLRVDLDDRPRQIVDPLHGKPAVTDWEVLHRAASHTRVAFHPRTGRTHQLRVHAAHPQGLGAPIVGDPLYGHAGLRLHLHAETLSFVHPATGQRVSFTRAAPF